jgi:hypothetical protein
MKAVIVFFAVLALSAAAAPSYWFSGSTSTNASFSNPSPTANFVDTLTGACATGATALGYQQFTINATESSFYYITALFEKAAISGGQIQIYNGAFVPTTPCVGIRTLALASRGGPHIAILEWLPQGIYTVVITARVDTANGIFAIHADAAKFNTLTTDASPVWNRPSAGYTTCSTAGYYVGYASWVFTVATSAYYDLFIFTYNSTATSNYFVAALYNQTVTFAGTGNYSNPADSCIAGYVESWDEETSYSGISQTGFSAGTLLSQWLTANYSYTVVAGSYSEGYYYQFGFWWRPTVVGQLGDTVNYMQPDIDAFGNQANPCTPETSPRAWQALVFRAAYATYVMDNGNSPSGGIGDTAGCLSSGSNAGTPYTVPPEGCPAGFLQCGDTYDGGSVSQLGMTLGANYTWVQSCYSSTCSASLYYAFFIYGGVQLGPSPVSTTGSETSGSAAVFASVALTAAALMF